MQLFYRDVAAGSKSTARCTAPCSISTFSLFRFAIRVFPGRGPGGAMKRRKMFGGRCRCHFLEPVVRALQIPAFGLFAFEADEQSFEVADAEATAAVAFDDLVKERGAILHRGGKNL